LAGAFLALDLAFLGANLVKVGEGGWVPLAIAGAVWFLMATWKRGSELLQRILANAAVPFDRFLDDLRRKPPVRVPGTAVFLSAHPEGVPVVLLHHLEHNKALHEDVIVLTVVTEEVPEVPGDSRIVTEPLAPRFHRVLAAYGFMETPDVPEAVARCCGLGLGADPKETSYYLGRMRLLPGGRAPMAKWRKLFFGFLARNARSATEYFQIPSDRVVELGARLEF
jgi:KUP system potassium uptake protein